MSMPLIEEQFSQLLVDCEEPVRKKRSKLWRRWIRVGPRDERPVVVLRNRIIRHYFLTGMKTAAIVAKTGLPASVCETAVAGLRQSKAEPQELEAVEARVANVQREFTADGVSGLLLKMDRMGSLSFAELERRLTSPEEVATVETRDLINLFTGVLKQFNLLVDRIRTSDPSTSARFLNTEEAKKQVEENQEILSKIEEPPFKIVGEA